VGFDDLRYAPDLGKVVAVPEGPGTVYLVDPDSNAVTQIPVPSGVASADRQGYDGLRRRSRQQADHHRRHDRRAGPPLGHGVTADQRGHAWVCDPVNGGILRITDPF
jgi:hypothetical protein